MDFLLFGDFQQKYGLSAYINGFSFSRLRDTWSQFSVSSGRTGKLLIHGTEMVQFLAFIISTMSPRITVLFYYK